MTAKKGQTKKKTVMKNKTTTKINGKRVIMITIIATALILFGNTVWNLVVQPTDVVVIEQGKIEKTDTVIGYVIRDEEVIQGNNYKNGIVPIKAEGEKVAKKNPVFRYYTNNEEEILRKIEELDVEYQTAVDGEKNIFTSDIKILDKQIGSLVEEISNTNNLNEITEHKRQLNEVMTKKAKIVGELSPKGSYIKKILSEKEEYEEQLESESEYVKANNSGIVSYKVDGYEELFDVKDFSTVTEEKLENIKMKTGQLIATSSECGKIINNFHCYIAVVIDSEEAEKATVGDRVKIRLANTQEVNCEIKHINDAGNKSKIIVFETKSGVEYLINYRKVSVDVIWWSDSGLKVPEDSLIREKNLTYVVRNRAGYTDKIPVKILRENAKFSLVDNYTTDELKEIGYTSEEIKAMPSVNLYDEIILNPET